MNLDKILSLIIAFSVILILIFLCFITQDLYEIWTVINETDTIIKTQQERIKNLEILVLRKMGVGV
jgi:cell division protein FtsL